MGFVADVDALLDRGWSWTRVASTYGLTKRTARRWHNDPPDRADRLARPSVLLWDTFYVLSDIQYPYHDRNLFETALQIVSDVEPDGILWNGDNIDFPQLSRFHKDPYRLKHAHEDVEGWHTEVRNPVVEAARLPDAAREVFIKGNHEDRDRRFIRSQAPELTGMVDSRAFLQLPEHVELFEYGRGKGPLLNGCLVSHGWRAQKHAAYTAKNSLWDIMSSCLIGHTHRVGQYTTRVLDPSSQEMRVMRSWEMGHMADETVIPKSVEGMQNWHQVAGAVLKVRKDGSAFDVDLLEVLNNGEVEHGGRTYKIERN